MSDEMTISEPGAPAALPIAAKVALAVAAVLLVAAVSVAGTLIATRQGNSSGDQAVRSQSVVRATTSSTATAIPATTTTSTTAPPTTAAPTTTSPALLPEPTPPVLTAPPVSEPQDLEPPMTCITGSLAIENIRATRDETGYDDYLITADFVNRTNVTWDSLGVMLSVSDASYPDREADVVSVHPATEEIRPGESIPMEGHFGFLSAAPPELGRVWWDPANWGDPNRAIVFPRVEGDWAFC